jgi:hypothetical protein
MRRRLLTVLLSFLAAVTVSEGLVRAISDSLPDPAPWPSNETELKAKQLELGNDYSIVFVGTSVTEAAVDPAMVTTALGRETYNAAIPFATQRSLQLWVERFVLPNADPDLLVVGIPVWSAEFAGAGDDGVLLDGLRRVEEFRTPPDPWVGLAHRSALVHWRTELKSIADLLAPANRLEETARWTSRGHQTGYFERTAGSLILRPGVSPSEVTFDFGPLIQLTEAARAHGVRVALLVEPASCDPRGRCLAPADIALLRQTYTLLAAELGVPVLEIEGPWPTEWYADPAHFNRAGTVAYTTRLAAALKELGL